MEVSDAKQTWHVPREFVGHGDTKEWLKSHGFTFYKVQTDKDKYVVQGPLSWKMLKTDVVTRTPMDRRKLTLIVNTNGIVMAIIYVTDDRQLCDMMQTTTSSYSG